MSRLSFISGGGRAWRVALVMTLAIGLTVGLASIPIVDAAAFTLNTFSDTNLGASEAVPRAGGVKAWGYNYHGQLGDGTQMQRLTPVDVSGLTSGVIALAAGDQHSCALTNAGGVKCWGWNEYGQLGDGTQTQRLTAVEVSGLTSGVTAIATSYNHTCALTATGGVKCWGVNWYGQLGTGTTTNRSTPTDVSGLTSGAIALAVGSQHTCALTGAGGVKCWGGNYDGQLGDGTFVDRYTPVVVSGLNGVTALAVGGYHACVLTDAGGVKCWGRNYEGELGDGTTTTVVPYGKPNPVDVSGLSSGVIALSAGTYHACALTSAGGVKCWGHGGMGQLGDGTLADRSTPVQVSGLTSGVTAIAAGRFHTCAVISGGQVKCWGYNGNGQLGDGTFTSRLLPVVVSGLNGGMVAAGGYHSLGLTLDATPPVIIPSVVGTPGNSGWHISNVVVSWTVSDPESDVSSMIGCETMAITADTSGVTLTCTATSQGGTASQSVTVKRDATAPTMNGSRAPAANTQGWNNTDVTVSFACADNLSGLAAGSPPADTVLTSEGAGQSTTGTCADLAGNSVSATASDINIDKTAPAITFTGRTPANAHGWSNTDVTINWGCADSLSGVSAMTVSQTLSGEGADQSATGTCADLAGNTASDMQSGVSIDKTDPTLTPSVTPNPVLLNGDALVTSGAEDELSGLAAESCEGAGTSMAGAAAVICTATDRAGNTASQSIAYLVIYRFEGFLQPINDTTHQTCPGCPASIFKGGSTVPVKFQLKDASGAVVQAVGTPQWVTPQRGGPTNAPIDESVYSHPATSGTAYRWDSQAQQYIFNWATKGYAVGYYWRIGVLLDDGQTYYVYIGLR